MLMNELSLDGLIIHSYGDNGFRISGTWYEGSILIARNTVIPCDFNFFRHTMIDPATVLLIGTGRQAKPLDEKFKIYLQEHKLTFDVMQTSSACRTYNVLRAEERPVSALLLHI